MILHAAAAGAQRHCCSAGYHDLQGTVKLFRKHLADQGQGDDTHGLLCIGHAVGKGHQGGGKHLQVAERPVKSIGGGIAEGPVDDQHVR